MQYDTQLPLERSILCHTLERKNQSDLLGFVRPVAEIIDGKLRPIDRSNFCATLKVFITSHYEDLEKSYPDRKLFQLNIRISEKNSDNVVSGLACKYVASATDATPIKPKDFFEVLHLPLPAPNSRVVAPDELPGTTYVFIHNGTSVFGPFKWVRLNREEGQLAIEIKFPDAPLPVVKLLQYQTYMIDAVKVDTSGVSAMINDRFFFQGLSVLNNAKYMDYASDTEVLQYCAKLAEDQGLRLLERSRVDALITHIRRHPKLDNEFVRNRLVRLAEVTESVTELARSVRDEVAKSIGAFLRSDVGRPFIQSYINQHETVFIEELRKEKEELINKELAEQRLEVTKAEQRVAELNDKKASLNDEIQRLNAEREKGVDLSQVYAESDEALRRKRAEIEEIESEINPLKEKHKLVLDIADLKADLRSFERQCDEAKEKAEQAREITRGLETTLMEKNSELQKRMADLKPFVEAINGSFSTQTSVQENIVVSTHRLAEASQKEVVQAVQSALAAKGRHLQEHEVANLLITIQQSFLTIFAGLPGTGKTSLARLLVDSQNISSRLREVAVSRGWTSQKDLIGYYNPLTSRFQSASTGLYSFLKAVGTETNLDYCAMAYVLLDEANLSPIEHYWSAFMGLTDHDADRKIILGNETVHLPNHLRFVATINYDGTTEPLSARLINRAPIIVLESPTDHTISAKILHKSIMPIPASQMKDLFGLVTSTPDLDGNERSIYEQIKKVLLENNSTFGRPIAISPRKENAIRQYCAKARILMNIDNDMMALDFAVQQHILPLIQGVGPRFAKRLDALRSILRENDLSKSDKVLDQIITLGESDLHTYDFFCW